MHHGIGYPPLGYPTPWDTLPLTLDLFKHVHLTPYPPPMVLTSSVGQQNTYGWQADSTHPPGMLSCY